MELGMNCLVVFQKAWLRFVVFFLLLTIGSVLYQNARRALYATTKLPLENLTKYDVDKVKKLIDVHIKADFLISLLHAGREIHTIDIDAQLFGEEAYTDVWGQSLVITQVHSKDAHDSTAFGVFSKGPDEVSLSNGNDPDDISSWASVDNAFWRAAYREAFVLRWGKRIAWAGVLTMSTSVLLALYDRYAKERPGT
jgi:hypothetical protein